MYIIQNTHNAACLYCIILLYRETCKPIHRRHLVYTLASVGFSIKILYRRMQAFFQYHYFHNKYFPNKTLVDKFRSQYEKTICYYDFFLINEIMHWYACTYILKLFSAILLTLCECVLDINYAILSRFLSTRCIRVVTSVSYEKKGRKFVDMIFRLSSVSMGQFVHIARH